MFRSTLIATFLFLLAACNEPKLAPHENPRSPEYRAMHFLSSIYIRQSKSEALKYLSDKQKRILSSYGGINGYSRHILNLKVNPNVKLYIDRRLDQVKYSNPDIHSVNLILSGEYRNKIIKDIRKILFIKDKGEWKIDGIGLATIK